MPNHVTNVIKAPKHVLDSLKSGDSDVDFNTVIPMPDENDSRFTADRTDYGNGMVGYSLGGYSPLDWARDNWGTKWNAYKIDRVSDTEVRFQTAWEHPDPVVEALTLKFPEDVFEIQYADEDLGGNLGEFSVKNGIIISEREFEEYSDEAQDYAARLVWGKSYEELRKEWDED